LPHSNEETVREALIRWSEGDLDGALATMRPDVEWHLAFQLPDLPHGKEIYRGHDEVRMIWDAFRSAWEEITLELEEAIHSEDEMLIACTRFHARGGASGVELDREVFYVFEFEAGQLARLRPFETEDEARAAVGLQP
jgi:ketosteroid isomerase-like protein